MTMTRHDPGCCGACYERRVRQLRRQGLAVGLCRQLWDCGTAGAAMLRVLEDATPAQIERLNALTATAGGLA